MNTMNGFGETTNGEEALAYGVTVRSSWLKCVLVRGHNL